MKRTALSLMLALITGGFSIVAAADDPAEVEVVKRHVAQAMPNARVDAIAPSPIAGFYEVIIGAQVFYVAKDGKYLIEGDLFELATKKNLTDARRSAGRMKAMSGIDEATMIVFSPKTVKYTITAFTDIDCGYCRKLHREMNDYLDKGIRVRYLAFPRSGVNTPSYYKAVGVWCADDRKAAMTQAKAGGKVEEKKCKHPVDQHLAAGEAVGVTGTPTLVMDNGTVIPGYVNATQLVQMLEDNMKGAQSKM